MRSDVTCDEFLGGRLALLQPRKGYRAGVDPVFLAASCPARHGQSVLELGCGVGTAILCLGARVPGLRLVAIEKQRAMAELAAENAASAGIELDVVQGDLEAMPAELRRQSFDQVILNPPYFRRSSSSASDVPSREASMGEETSLETWLSVAARRLAPKGWLTLIHRPERLGDILSGLAGLGGIQVQPLQPRVGRDATLLLIRARKGARAPLRLHAPVVLHSGARHEADGEDYAPEISAVLRHGAAFPGFLGA